MQYFTSDFLCKIKKIGMYMCYLLNASITHVNKAVSLTKAIYPAVNWPVLSMSS